MLDVVGLCKSVSTAFMIPQVDTLDTNSKPTSKAMTSYRHFLHENEGMTHGSWFPVSFFLVSLDHMMRSRGTLKEKQGKDPFIQVIAWWSVCRWVFIVELNSLSLSQLNKKTPNVHSTTTKRLPVKECRALTG